SSFYGNSLWVGMFKNRFRWERILDWMSTNRKLFELALHLEETIVSKLGIISAPKYVLVVRMEESPGSGHSDLAVGEVKWKPDTDAYNAAAAAENAGLTLDGIRGGLEPHLTDFRNRVFFHHLWDLLRR